jgi:hypothetical protein
VELIVALSDRMRETLAAVRRAHPGWYRAAGSGQRVTLASLWRKDLLERRAHRGNAGEADAAYEYRLSPMVRAELGIKCDDDPEPNKEG